MLKLFRWRFLDLFDDKAPEPTAIQIAMTQTPIQQHGARAPMMIPATAPPDIPADDASHTQKKTNNLTWYMHTTNDCNLAKKKIMKAKLMLMCRMTQILVCIDNKSPLLLVLQVVNRFHSISFPNKIKMGCYQFHCTTLAP